MSYGLAAQSSRETIITQFELGEFSNQKMQFHSLKLLMGLTSSIANCRTIFQPLYDSIEMLGCKD